MGRGLALFSDEENDVSDEDEKENNLMSQTQSNGDINDQIKTVYYRFDNHFFYKNCRAGGPSNS